VADLHALTSRPEDARQMSRRVKEMLLDWASVGLDPERSVWVLQSGIPEIGELEVLLSMLSTIGRVERQPTFREAAGRVQARRGTLSLGRLAYPVLMAADILLFRATEVPVGEDQESHLEFVRSLARRFNRLYGPTFPEPQAVLSSTPRLPGIDGRQKMSKSLGNAIYLSDPPEVLRRRVFGMFTDPGRVRADVPGHVEGNPVFAYHEAFNPDRAQVEDLRDRYRQGRVQDVEVKDLLVRALETVLDPIRERRLRWVGREEDLRQALTSGTGTARSIARRALEEVLAGMGL
jgi:tryptophanyl-tRNA synthetase